MVFLYFGVKCGEASSSVRRNDPDPDCPVSGVAVGHRGIAGGDVPPGVFAGDTADDAQLIAPIGP